MVHRWVEGSLAQWLEPSFHKQLLISTGRVQIKKKERKRRRRKENVEMGIRMQIHEKVEKKVETCHTEAGADFQVHKEGDGERVKKRETSHQKEIVRRVIGFCS